MDARLRDVEVVIFDRDAGRSGRLTAAITESKPTWIVRPLHPDDAWIADHNIDPAAVVLVNLAGCPEDEAFRLVKSLHTSQPAARIIVTDMKDEGDKPFRYLEAGAWSCTFRGETLADIRRTVVAAGRPMG